MDILVIQKVRAAESVTLNVAPAQTYVIVKHALMGTHY